MTYERVKEFLSEFMPELTDSVSLYSGTQTLFDAYGVEEAIQKALDKRVNLKSGGYLIIEQTEAMTTIDINTGAFVGHRNLSHTIFNTNIEATQAIAHQLQLRNLGGIIIIDFIDMQEEEHRQRVLQSLEDVQLAMGAAQSKVWKRFVMKFCEKLCGCIAHLVQKEYVFMHPKRLQNI